MKPTTLLVHVLVLMTLSGCAYLRETGRQARYAAQQLINPKQRTSKLMISTENFFVYGKIKGDRTLTSKSLTVLALSNTYAPREIVDSNRSSQLGYHYGLNLPEGNYQLLLVCDLNQNGSFEETEIIGNKTLSLSEHETPGKVLGSFDLEINGTPVAYHGAPFPVAAPTSEDLPQSLFYPKGTIRSLDDPIFSEQMASLGMYESAAFLEVAPMMFYALEEDVGYKIPVIFVHGINGSPREFKDIVEQLDRRLYRPWFFYYPSGNDLGQLSEFFYDIFLSGKVIPLFQTPTVIIAHSMGGVIVREAMNRYQAEKKGAKVERIVTIASPLGGHPGARMGESAPLVLPAWRDMNPDSEFIHHLHRKPLPASVGYHLFYAYGNDRSVKIGENSDGVVPISSQLTSSAQKEAARQYGINDTHTGILKNPELINQLLNIVNEVRPKYSQALLAEFAKGGYTVELSEDYSAMERYYIRHYAYFFDALASSRVAPEDPVQEHFVKACRGEVPVNNPAEEAWIKYRREHKGGK